MPDGWLGEICKGCGRHNVVGYHVPDEIWQRVVGVDVILCLACFDERAALHGIAWEHDVELFAMSTAGWHEASEPGR